MNRIWVLLEGFYVLLLPDAIYHVKFDKEIHPWDMDCIVEQLLCDDSDNLPRVSFGTF